jgi:hypothetical protein
MVYEGVLLISPVCPTEPEFLMEEWSLEFWKLKISL